MRIRKAAQLLLRGRDLGDERLVLRLDAYYEQPHRRIAEIHAAMHDIRPHIICLSGVQHTRLLAGALKTLNERERDILVERRLKDNPATLEDLSHKYNISRERVRQIEVRSFEKLQKAMKTRVAEQRAEASVRAAAHTASAT